jgi:hypothetical protein
MLMRMTRRTSMRFFLMVIVSLGWFLMLQSNSFAGGQDMSVIAHASSGPLACEIRKAAAGDTVQLTGVVSSSVALSGRVRFVLTKSGPSGNSNISQGNSFDLAAGVEDHVSHVTINLQHKDHAVVEFIATSKDGVVCHATANLDF